MLPILFSLVLIHSAGAPTSGQISGGRNLTPVGWCDVARHLNVVIARARRDHGPHHRVVVYDEVDNHRRVIHRHRLLDSGIDVFAFLAPQPVRGKPNQPANVVATAKVVAEVRGTTYEQLERTVEENAARVFGW